MSETWTEYALQWSSGYLEGGYKSRENASKMAAAVGATVVGRNVTASDWLPVDTDGAK